MAENEQVTVEDLSPTPLQPIVEEQEETPEVPVEDTAVVEETLPGQPAPEDEGFVQPPRPVVAPDVAQEIQSKTPGIVVEVVPDVPTEEAPVAEEGAQAPLEAPQFLTDQQPVAAGVTPTPDPTTVDGSPILPPARFEDRIADPSLTDDDIRAIKADSFKFYRDEILGGNGDPEARMEAINKANYYRVPAIDAQGNPVIDENGRVVYESDPIPFISADPEMRVIQLFELARSNNGYYHFFEGDMNDPEAQTFGQLDIGLNKMLQGNQNPLTSFFYRVESERGGMRNYTGILKNAGINDPARLTYLARHQAQAGPFDGIELVRMGAGIRDGFKFLYDIGFGDGFQVPGTEFRIGLSQPLQEFTATIPFYLYEAFDPQTYDPLSGPTPYQGIRESDVPATIAKITRGGIAPWQFDDAVQVLKKEYPHATDTQIEAILSYSPDLLTLTKRWATESLLTGGAMLGTLKFLDKGERAGFMDFVHQKINKKTSQGAWKEVGNEGVSGFSDVGEALVALERAGLDRTAVLKQYYEGQGLSAATSSLLAKSFDLEMGLANTKRGVYYDEILKPKIEQGQKELAELDKKLDAALEMGNDDLIKSLTARKMLLQKDIISYQEQSNIPKWMRNYIVDESIATGTAALAYQLTYDLAGENPTTSSIAALVFGVATAFPGVRDVAVNGVEDIKLALSSNLNSKQSKAAIRIRRHLEKAPEELRESILLFMEKRAIAVEELASLVYPKGHEKAGQRIIDPELLDQSFAQMSGLVSLRRLEDEIMKANVDIQKDAGGLSANLLTLEQNYVQRTKLVDALAQSIDAMRYLRFSDQYDPRSESGQMIDFLIKFYDASSDDLTRRKNNLTAALNARDRDFSRYSSGLMEHDELEGYLDGTESLANLIALDRAEYIKLGLTPDTPAEEAAQILQTYHVNLNTRVANSMEANTRFTFDADDRGDSANRQLRTFVTVAESEAYAGASKQFDDLRKNPLYKDIRMDMTAVLDAFVAQGADGDLGINAHALSQYVPMYGQGTQASRYLAKKNLPSPVVNALTKLYEESAAEYLDDLGRKIDSDTLDSIYAKADLDDQASDLDRWFAVRDYFDANKAKFGDQYEELKPRLGVDPATFMHIISGLGDRGSPQSAKAVRELRESLLARGETEFYDNFYEPKSARTSIAQFSTDYKAVRENYRETYIVPFREESGVVASLVRNPDSKVRRKALKEMLTELGVGDEAVDIVTLRENFFEVFEGITGGPIDINTPKGKMIRSILTSLVHEEIARTPGAIALRKELARDATTEAKPLIIPERAGAIEEALQAGGNTPLLDNLLKKNPDTGDYLFADVNGNPLVDPSVNNLLSFDELLGYGIREAEMAQFEINNRLTDERTLILGEMDNKNSRISRELETRKILVDRLRNAEGGIGNALLAKASSTGGLEDISQIRQDYIFSMQQDGVDTETAGKLFDDVIRDAVLDEVMNRIMSVGAEVPMKTIDPKTNEQRMAVHRTAEMDLNKMATLLGLRGDNITESADARALKTLVGEETYEHMQFVFETLYQFNPKTGALNVTGTSIPLSAESLLSRGTSFFRGVISLRWLVSEAAIRSSREANYQLTKMMLGDPKVGREVLDMLTSKNFNLDKREPFFMPVLISQIAKNDAIQQRALEQSQTSQESQDPVDAQMNSLTINP